MFNAIAIDPGMSKCGLVIVDIKQKKVCEAKVIRSNHLIDYVKKIYQKDQNIELLIGNGTTSQKYIKELSKFSPKLIIVEEKNSTYRAKQRYFEIFPLKGFQHFLPRDIFILNKNLDALAALVIIEDYYNLKFVNTESISTKTWLR